MISPDEQTSGDVSAQLARLLPELGVALYDWAPHHHGRGEPIPRALTGRQMEAVVFLAHRDSVTMGEFADGLAISRAAASELVTRLLEKGVIRRDPDESDRRVVRVRLAGRAEGYATDVMAEWSQRLAAVFARFPELDPRTLVAFLRTLIDELKGRTDR
jgi:MarR family transcriptional regulator, organic hydroperoxide resistance regulator